ncbi:hypothetical protein BDV18DRAFT_164050 [Aspergillus unguis]
MSVSDCWGAAAVKSASAYQTRPAKTGNPPLILPFPVTPVGFVAPPAAVPYPQKKCSEDFTENSCKDCEPLEGWCTTGENMGCPCREECPADGDEVYPSCSAEDCKGEQGACTIGRYKDCKCSVECPDEDDWILVCSDEVCNAEEDKCTTNDEKSLAALVEDMEQFFEEQDKEEIEATCASRDYSKALGIDTSFMNKLASKFCEGDKKERSQDLTAKDIDSSAYEGYSFNFEMNPGDCSTDCAAAVKSTFSRCQGIDSHTLQASASAKISSCDGTFSYKITAPEKDDDDDDDDETFTQNGWQNRVCHDRDQFGSHGDVHSSTLSQSAVGCLVRPDDRALLKPGSEPLVLKVEYGSTKYQLSMFWQDNCRSESETIDARFPGREDGTVKGDSCMQALVKNWKDCNNGGAGGYIDYSCVRYDFRPTWDA